MEIVNLYHQKFGFGRIPGRIISMLFDIKDLFVSYPAG